MWANAPLDIRKSSFKAGALLNDAKLVKILDRAGGIPRMNISIIDLAECHDLTAESLWAVSKRVDARAHPPALINVRDCGRLDSRELVAFLRELEAKLVGPWKKKKTKLVLMSDMYENDVDYLGRFDTGQMSEDGFEYDFQCQAGCTVSFDDAEFCYKCQVHTCLCEIERHCEECGERLCDDCECPDCCPSELEPGLTFRDQSDYDDSEDDDYW
eukprot:TRINITY_DN16886_c0_g1_i1.p1 TRINITY_DN16886_c0_g1~~TRINITY_DN16886_c0_g1_i1.p1  ORF type:complete len:214 (+),score=21.90 TRINITY_DN16886_c0_g1_i1:190-831(+)